MFKDLICERVDLCANGKNPYLIHEFKNSYFVVGDHQFYEGYSLLLFKQHIRELHELTLAEHLVFSEELYIANKAIDKTFSPWKINNLSLGNKDQHVHWHIIPRYENDKYHREFPFTDEIKREINRSDYLIKNDEMKELAARIRDNL